MARLLQLCLTLLLLSGASAGRLHPWSGGSGNSGDGSGGSGNSGDGSGGSGNSGDGSGSGGSGGYEDSGSGSGDDERMCEHMQCTHDEVCKENNGRYGCSCVQPTPEDSDFDATRTCESSTGSISLSRCQLFDTGFPVRSLHLNDPDCKGEISNGRVEFNFDNHENLCGTTLETNKTHFTYKNAVQMSDGSYELISRDSWLSINFSCVYPLIETLSLPMVIEARQSVISKILPGSSSSYDIHMVAYRDSSFDHPYNGRIELDVNHKLFVAVEVKRVDKEQFSLVMDNCWATPVNKTDYSLRWDLIEKECPNRRDKTVHMLENGESLSGRFSFNMFTFTHQSKQLYLHCKIHLCLKKGGHCKPKCGHDDDDDDDDDDDHHRRRRSLDFHDTAAISMSF